MQDFSYGGRGLPTLFTIMKEQGEFENPAKKEKFVAEKKVVLYTQTECADCRSEKEFLSERDVEFRSPCTTVPTLTLTAVK